jgi:hypothetical protein
LRGASVIGVARFEGVIEEGRQLRRVLAAEVGVEGESTAMMVISGKQKLKFLAPPGPLLPILTCAQRGERRRRRERKIGRRAVSV